MAARQCASTISPDRRRRQRAVGQQVVEALVAADVLVRPVGVDQSSRTLDRHAALPHERAQACDGREPRPPARQRLDLRLDDVEQFGPVARRLVTDVVDEAREGVDAEQLGANPAWQQAKCDREVLRRRLPHRPLTDAIEHRAGAATRRVDLVHGPPRRAVRTQRAHEPRCVPVSRIYQNIRPSRVEVGPSTPSRLTPW